MQRFRLRKALVGGLIRCVVVSTSDCKLARTDGLHRLCNTAQKAVQLKQATSHLTVESSLIQLQFILLQCRPDSKKLCQRGNGSLESSQRESLAENFPLGSSQQNSTRRISSFNLHNFYINQSRQLNIKQQYRNFDRPIRYSDEMEEFVQFLRCMTSTSCVQVSENVLHGRS